MLIKSRKTKKPPTYLQAPGPSSRDAGKDPVSSPASGKERGHLCDSGLGTSFGESVPLVSDWAFPLLPTPLSSSPSSGALDILTH